MPASFLVGYAVQDKGPLSLLFDSFHGPAAGIIEMRRRKIAWNYIRSWLVLDLTIVAIVWASKTCSNLKRRLFP